MFNTKNLEELKNSALIVRTGLENLIINSTAYEGTTIEQAVAVFTVCDAIVSDVHDYLTYPEEYGNGNLDLFLRGMDYLLRGTHAEVTDFDTGVLQYCTDNLVLKHYANMIWLLRNRMYYA